MQKTEDLLNGVFQSRGEAIGAFLQTAVNAGLRGHVEGSYFIILDWVLQLITCPAGYFFQRKKTKRDNGYAK